IMESVRGHFRPELLNRLAEILIFNRLGRKNIHSIVDIQIARLAARLKDKNIELQLADSAKDWLGEHGYDPVYGARPLKRVIQRSLENPLAKLLLEGKIGENSVVKVSANEVGLLIV
ncbi:MAG: ATP-dependent chaperone ClpB, partial [Pseudomonadota bacterium]